MGEVSGMSDIGRKSHAWVVSLIGDTDDARTIADEINRLRKGWRDCQRLWIEESRRRRDTGAVEALHAICELTHQDAAWPARCGGFASEVHRIARAALPNEGR